MGFHFLVTGFFLKMVLANNLGRIIEPYFNPPLPLDASAPDLWLAAFLYYGQIYSDFAGYSLMALGMARLLGYHLPANFRSPMRAGSLRDFWQRWHISLSSWLRDYLYIPLGGSRKGTARTYANLMITMLLGGLWHGAGWGFVIWGALHGTGLVVERWLPTVRRERKLPYLARAVIVQLWVTWAWVFFRCPDLRTALQFTARMLDFKMKFPIGVHTALLAGLVFAVPVVAHNFVPLALKAAGRKRLGLILGASTGVMLLLNLVVQSPETVFIYFRF
jgi:alginate O-acetyltransferase complex protein AlgI